MTQKHDLDNDTVDYLLSEIIDQVTQIYKEILIKKEKQHKADRKQKAIRLQKKYDHMLWVLEYRKKLANKKPW